MGETVYHYFELSGLPGIEGIEGHGILETQREDIGTVWISDVRPYSVIAQAKDGSDTVATIRAGVWTDILLDVSCWQVIP